MRKRYILDSINDLFCNPEGCTLENRIFNAVMILIFLTSAVVTVYNVLLDNNIVILSSSAASIAFALLIYCIARKKRNFQSLVVPVVVYFFLIMIVTWLANAGTMGAGSCFFFLLMTIGTLLLKKPFPLFMIAIVLTLIALLAVEYYFPGFLLGYETRTQRFLDVGISLILCLVFNGMIIHAVFREYLRERQQKDALLAQVILDKEEMRRAHDEIRVLQGCLPICANCKKIKDDAGSWNQMEVFIRDHSEADFSHGICPDCARRLYPEIEIENWIRQLDGVHH